MSASRSEAAQRLIAQFQRTVSPYVSRRPWSAEDDQALIAGRKGGAGWTEIAATVGRSEEVCRARHALLTRQTPSIPAGDAISWSAITLCDTPYDAKALSL